MKKVFYFPIFTLFVGLGHIYSQTTRVLIPCDGANNPIYVDVQDNLALGKTTQQSSTYFDGGFSSLAVDGIVSGPNAQYSRTSQQYQPWWEVDLGDSYMIRGLKIWQNSPFYTSGLSNYYIFFSEVPLVANTVSDLVSSPDVYHIYINQALSPGYEIPAQYKRARYIRIQLEGIGAISTYEIQVPGGPGGVSEICNNGIDDDFDCKTDCSDSDCGPIIWWVNKKNPTCPICSDGSIEIRAYGQNLTYSIDNGVTFHPCIPIPGKPDWCGFNGLGVGDYNVIVSNGICNTIWRNNPVRLLAPIGDPNGCCNNGDFESGNFDNWTGGIGENDIAGQDPPFTNEDIDPGYPDPDLNYTYNDHLIISNTSNYIDQRVPWLPVLTGNTGTYLVRLGGLNSGNGAARLTYCFTVTECNKTFLFNYMVVLDYGDHGIDEDPYFQFVIRDKTDNTEIKRSKRVAAPNDPFFNTYQVNTNIRKYTYWKCETTDLSDRIGHEICIEFIVADCIQDQHAGYAYIDGLCNSVEDMTPVPILKGFYDDYCAGQKIIFDGSESYGYNQFGWSICELAGTQEINCADQPLSPDGDIGNLDLEEFYESKGYTLTCGKTYRVKLILDNDCVEPVLVSKDIEYHCEEGIILNYTDIVNCLGDTDLEIPGTITNCSPCIINWTPSEYLNNSHIPNPIIEGSLNVLATKQKYHIVAENSLGCVEEADVNIINLVPHTIDYIASKEINFCDVSLIAECTTIDPTPRGLITVTFVNLTTGVTINADIEGNDQIATTWKFRSTIARNAFSSGIWQARFIFDSNILPLPTNCPPTVVDIGLVTASDIYYGDFQILLPNGFTPNGDGFSDKWRFVVRCDASNPVNLPPGYSCEEYGHRAYWGRVTFYRRWGGIAYQKEVWGTPEHPFSKNDLTWDGINLNGEPEPSDVLVCILELKNCTYPNLEQCPDTPIPGCTPDPNATPAVLCRCNEEITRMCSCSKFVFDVFLDR